MPDKSPVPASRHVNKADHHSIIRDSLDTKSVHEESTLRHAFTPHIE